ncbi:hypothetical protein Tco_1294262 [Tanacetum coccineum]
MELCRLTYVSLTKRSGSSTTSGGALVGTFLSGSVWSNRSQLTHMEYGAAGKAPSCRNGVGRQRLLPRGQLGGAEVRRRAFWLLSYSSTQQHPTAPVLLFNRSEHRPVKAEAAGSSPVSATPDCESHRHTRAWNYTLEGVSQSLPFALAFLHLMHLGKEAKLFKSEYEFGCRLFSSHREQSSQESFRVLADFLSEKKGKSLVSSIDFHSISHSRCIGWSKITQKLIQKLRLAWQCEVLVDLSEPLYPKPRRNSPSASKLGRPASSNHSMSSAENVDQSSITFSLRLSSFLLDGNGIDCFRNGVSKERHRCSFVLSSDSVRIVNAVLVILIDDVYHGRCVLEDDGVCVVRWIKSCLILPISYEEIETGVIFRHCVERYAWFHSCDMRVDIVGHPDSLQ